MTKKEPLYTGEMRIGKDETDGEYLVVGIPFNKDKINSFSKIIGLDPIYTFKRIFFNRYELGICALKEKPKAGGIFEVIIRKKGKKDIEIENGSGYYKLKSDGTFEQVDIGFVFRQFKRQVGKLIIPDETF